MKLLYFCCKHFCTRHSFWWWTLSTFI